VSQLSLIGWRPPVSAPRASEQDHQAARCGRGIDEAVIEVAKRRSGAGVFSLEDFTAHVRRHLATLGRGCAPDSPRRRLKALVDAGFIGAACVDRSRSLWRVSWVRGETP
jgi:hypothetical protein